MFRQRAILEITKKSQGVTRILRQGRELHCGRVGIDIPFLTAEITHVFEGSNLMGIDNFGDHRSLRE